MKPILIPALISLLLTLPFIMADATAGELPEGFDYADRHIPRLSVDLKYYSADNFVGKPIEGYRSHRAILTLKAIHALARVQDELNLYGLGIKLYDAYRPQRSVDHFVRWSRNMSATATKPAYYPNVEKRELFNQGYIDRRSGHSRGSTVDLTVIDLETGEELDMGSRFDLFDPVSWPRAKGLNKSQRAHRLLLATIMEKHRFIPYPKEWWHFTLADEPYPETYFDFPVE